MATAAGLKPVVMGKPSPVMFEEVQKHNPGITTERTIMIGDRLDEKNQASTHMSQLIFKPIKRLLCAL